MNSSPVRQHLVLVGGGHAHLQVLRHLATDPLDGLRVTLISREVYVPYSGMVPGYVAGHYVWEDIHIDFMSLCARCGASLIREEVCELDIPNQRIKMNGRPDLHFDLLSINVGSASNLPVLQHQEGHVSVRPISNFLNSLDALFMRAKKQAEADVTIVGSGAASIELAFALAHRFQMEPAIQKHRIAMVTISDSCLSEHSEKVQKKVLRKLHKVGVQVITSFEVINTEKGRLLAKDGRQLECADVFWATEAKAQNWLGESGLPIDEQGFVLVDEHLACIGVPRVFAVGDIASMLHTPRPKAGVFAVRQGVILQKNIYRKLLGLSLKRFKPQRRYLSLISLGRRSAMAIRGRLYFQGRLAWQWKNWLDRRFLKKFANDNTVWPMKKRSGRLVKNPADHGDREERGKLSPNAMYCGGCAAKLGSDSLNRVLGRLGLWTTGASGAGDDAAVTSFDSGVRLAQSLDGFRAILPDAYLTGRIAAVHALNDIYAMGAKPLNAMAWVTVPWSHPKLMEDDLFHILSGALESFKEAGVTLVGGHSGEGAELSVGFSVTGVLTDGILWQKGGLQDQDALILTKPIGSGALFSANMRGLCRSQWLSGAIARLIKGNGPAQAILQQHGVTGCTDITGFGLLGHAMEMAYASDYQLLINASSVPFLEGAGACFAMGAESSLQSTNEQVFRNIQFVGLGRNDIRARLMADPMTAGGLLAGVPADQTDKCLAALKDAGYRAACVGKVTKGGQERIQLFADGADNL